MDLICISLKDTEAVLLAAPNPPACPHENRVGNVWTARVRPLSAHIRAAKHNLVFLSDDGSTQSDKGAPVLGEEAFFSGLRSTSPDFSTCEKESGHEWTGALPFHPHRA